MPNNSGSDGAIVTRVIAYIVRAGEDAHFQAWQKTLNEKLLQFPGALRVDVLPANMTAAGHEWIVIYRFRSEAELSAWLRSNEHEDVRASAPDIFVGTETQYTLSGAEAPDAGETIVTSNKVIAGKECAYEAADKALNEVAARFPGFASAKVLKPRPGSRTWSTIVRFNSKPDMDRWLGSPERAAGRKEMYKYTESHEANVVPTGFGSWFAVNAEDSIEAPAWKQAMTVLAALFPTVMILTLTVGRLQAPLAVNIFIGNTLSTIALTWALMPVFTRAMAWWLSPRATPNETLRGSALLLGIYAVEIAIFLVVNSWTGL